MKKFSLKCPAVRLAFCLGVAIAITNEVAIAQTIAGIEFAGPIEFSPGSESRPDGSGSQGEVEFSPRPEVLVPLDRRGGRTNSAQPKVFVYVPETDLPTATFIAYDDTDRIVANTSVPLPDRAGIYELALADLGVVLRSEKRYYWYLSIAADPWKDSVSEGWIERVNPDEGHTAGGLWYEALAIAAERYRQDPDDPKAEADWRSLLASAGLQDWAGLPLRGKWAIAPTETTPTAIAPTETAPAADSSDEEASARSRNGNIEFDIESARAALDRRSTPGAGSRDIAIDLPNPRAPEALVPFVSGGASQGRVEFHPSPGERNALWGGLTYSAQPKIFVYLSATALPTAELKVTDDTGRVVVETSLPLPDLAGIYELALADLGVVLEIDKVHFWQLLIAIDPNNPSRGPVAEGWIARIRPDEWRDAEIAELQPELLAKHYAFWKLWYEALAIAAERYRQNPDDPEAEENWRSLLQSAGLQDWAGLPLRGKWAIAPNEDSVEGGTTR